MHIKLPYSQQSGHIPSVDRLKVGELWINGADNILGTKNEQNQIVQFAQFTPEQRTHILNDFVPKVGVIDKVTVSQTATKVEGNEDGVIIDINDDSDTAIEYTVMSSALSINVNKTTGHKATKLVITKPAQKQVVISWNGVNHWLSTPNVPKFGDSLDPQEICVAIFTSSTINCVNVIYNTEADAVAENTATWGLIDGSISDQEDLQAVLNSKLARSEASSLFLGKNDRATSALVAESVSGSNVQGVVGEATKASQDALGRVISTTYAEAAATTSQLDEKVSITQYNADKQTFAIKQEVNSSLDKKVEKTTYDKDKLTFATKEEVKSEISKVVPAVSEQGSNRSEIYTNSSATNSKISITSKAQTNNVSFLANSVYDDASFTISAQEDIPTRARASNAHVIKLYGSLSSGIEISQHTKSELPIVIKNTNGDITLTNKNGTLTLNQLEALNKNALLKNEAAGLYSTKADANSLVNNLRTEIKNEASQTYQTKANAASDLKATNTKIDAKADKTYVDNTLKTYASKAYVDEKVSAVYRYKGSVASYDLLPKSNNVKGDVWNVVDTGKNFVWSGTEWDDIGGVVDLTPYLMKDEASTTYVKQGAKVASAVNADKAGSATSAEIAQKLAAPRLINLGGDIDGSAGFDGSDSITINAILANTGVKGGSYGQGSALTLPFGGSLTVPYFTVDTKGRITNAAHYSVKLPSAPTSISGNAATATKLATSRSIALTGDVNGSTMFDGTSNISIVATAATMTGASSAAGGVKGMVPAPAINQQEHYLRGDGTWSIPVNTKVSQFVAVDNVEYPVLTKRTNGVVNTTDTSNFAATVTLNPSLSQITAKVFKGSLAGNASTATTATKLATACTIAIGGAVTGSATSFDGSNNITINTTAINGAKVTGTVPAATKATQDGSGHDIAATYALKSELASLTERLAKLEALVEGGGIG